MPTPFSLYNNLHFILFTAFALHIDPAALIAKVLPASALHMIAAMTFLHPVIAKRALLKFGSFGKLHKGVVVFIVDSAYLVFFAGLTFVENHSAV